AGALRIARRPRRYDMSPARRSCGSLPPSRRPFDAAGRPSMTRSHAASVLAAPVVLATLALVPDRAAAQTVVKIGVVNSYTRFVAQAREPGPNGKGTYPNQAHTDLT